MKNLIIGLCLGWSAGFWACWIYFRQARLIRSREEWEKAHKKDIEE